MNTLSFSGSYLSITDADGNTTSSRIRRLYPNDKANGVVLQMDDMEPPLNLLYADCSTNGVTPFANLLALITFLLTGLKASGSVASGSSSVVAKYISPTDFTATYTSSSTITLTGLPVTIASGMQIVYIKVRNTATNFSETYVNSSGGYSIGYSAGVVTLYLDGVAAAKFTSNDVYEVGVNAQDKAYDPIIDVYKFVDQAPESAKVPQDSLIDTTNTAAATIHLPSATGMSIDGYKCVAISGKAIDVDGTVTITIEETCDEDAATADFIDTTPSWHNEKAAPNTGIGASITVTNGTVDFKIIKHLCNATFIRVKVVTSGATNTVIIKMRRVY